MMTVHGNYGTSSGATLAIKLFGLTGGVACDQLNVNGLVDLDADQMGGALLQLNLGFSPALGALFAVLGNDGNGVRLPHRYANNNGRKWAS